MPVAFGVAMKASEFQSSDDGVDDLEDDRENGSSERALTMSLSLLQAALESTADGLLIVDQQGRITQFNRRFQELWRIPDAVVAARDDEVAIGFVLSQLTDPNAFVDKVRELYSNPHAESFDVLSFKDGRRFERYSRPQLVDGESVGRVWSFRDVTERVRAEEMRFRSVTESAQDAIVTADPSGKIVGWNRGAQITFGYTDSEITGRPVSELMPERYREAHARGFARLTAEGGDRTVGRTIALHGTRKDGTEFPCEISINTWTLGTEIHSTAFIRDITERRRAEEALKMQASILESMKESVVVTDDEGVIQFANAALESSFGYEHGELLGKNIGALEAGTPEESAERVGRIFEQLAKTGSWRGECPNRRKDGSTFTSEISVTALSINNKRLFVSVQEDVTEKRAIQSRLVIADRMASVGMLAAGVAHEINNPLAYVIANLELIAEEIRPPGDDLQREPSRDLETMVAQARQGAERVRKIVRDLKTFSRADQDSPKALDVGKVIDQAIDLAFNEIRHRARLVREFQSAPLVEADEARLCQVFVILLMNAAQAIPEGHSDTNEVRVRTGTDQNGQVFVDVCDSGSGISADLLDRIFDPFFTTKPIGQGTGLGLSICHGIVTKLGGEITVKSVVGRGSTFRVVLPPTQVVSIPSARPASKSPAAAKGRVLVVDDDAALGAAISRILRCHDVRIVSSGADALDLIAKGEIYDAILCDLMMPGMTGMDLHRELVSVAPEYAHRMVFMTGGAFSPGAKEFVDHVADETVDKPFDARALRSVVQRLIDRGRVG